MDWHNEWHLFWQQIIATDCLTWLAVALGVAEVLLAKANKIALYPAGIAGTLITIYILYRSGLFAECLLNGYYVVMSVYGWWHWIKKKYQPPVQISYCNRKEWITAILIVTGAYVLLAGMLKYGTPLLHDYLTPSTVPFWDAWVSATAWAGMWLLAKRKIENWILLNISNAFAIPLLMYKQLPMFAILTLFLFIVAVAGYFQWRRSLS